jgi:C-terminal processing protease CtpA/Prc
LWGFVGEHKPKRLVIDMRQNGGGNYTKVRDYLIARFQFMPELNQTGRLYILIGRGTYSAAMTNATDFRRETDAILVGEPTGARPNGYQELSQFTLPHSKLQVCCSIRRYRFQDKDTPAVMPDVQIDPDWSAYKAGRDPVLEWVLAQP